MRRRVLLTGFLSLLGSYLWAQAPNRNYVLSRTYTQAVTSLTAVGGTLNGGADQAMTKITYLDGLGKPQYEVKKGEKRCIPVLALCYYKQHQAHRLLTWQSPRPRSGSYSR